MLQCVANSAQDLIYLTQALELARRGLYTTDPNPRVGCLIAREQIIIGSGWHRRAGEPHAERLALIEAGERARGATVYVTLEPCCHYGLTPPCTEELIAAGVARVVCAMRDPNPLVAGQGIIKLQEAGIQVDCGLLENEARALNPGFIKRMEQGRPWIRGKFAASLDGRTALAHGESRWISSEEARRDVQFLRAASSAILTGIETVLHDDPSFTVRLAASELPGLQFNDSLHQPLRIVLDSQWRTPLNSQILKLPGVILIVGVTDSPQKIAALEATGAQTWICAEREGRVDLSALFIELGRRGINEILVESGATLAGALLSEGLLDEIILYLAPHLMGDSARGLFHLPQIQTMNDRIALHVLELRSIGSDWRIRAVPKLFI